MKQEPVMEQFKQMLNESQQHKALARASRNELVEIHNALVNAAEAPVPATIVVRSYVAGYDRTRDPEYLAWFQDHIRYVHDWVGQWKPAVAKLRAAQFSRGRVANIYDVDRDDPHIDPLARKLIGAVREVFLDAMGVVAKEWPDIERRVVDWRTTGWSLREYLPDYFHGLARGILRLSKQPLDRDGSAGLADYSMHWVRHRDLAMHLHCEQTKWYVSARRRPKKTFTGPCINGVRGVPSLYRLGPLLENFRGLADTRLEERAPDPQFLAQLHSPEAGQNPGKRSAHKSAQLSGKSDSRVKKVRSE